MADEADVEVALVAAAAGAIYPNGTGAAPVGGYACRIGRGEPNAEALNVDLAAGVVNVCVTLVELLARNTTRYAAAWQPTAQQPQARLDVRMTGTVATFTGTGGAGSIVGVRAGRRAVSYATVAGDTPESVAGAMAQRVPGATAEGAVLTLPQAGGAALAVVYGVTEAVAEVRRQEHCFGCAVYAPTPDGRTAVAATIDTALAGVDFLPLADGSAGRLRYRTTRVDDVPSRANLWRRDLLYTVEYGSRVLTQVPPMVFGSLALNEIPAGTTTPPAV